MTPKEKAYEKWKVEMEKIDDGTWDEISFKTGWDACRDRAITDEAYQLFRALVLKYGIPTGNNSYVALAAEAFTAVRAFREVAEGVENAK